MEINFKLDEIEAAANAFHRRMGESKVFAFYGQMGAGKTTFITALCRFLGVQETVSSPTFSIINEYNAARGRVYHLDLYRLKDEEEATNAGVEDVLFSGATCFVEWPERAPGILPPGTIEVRIELTGPDSRKILVQ